MIGMSSNYHLRHDLQRFDCAMNCSGETLCKKLHILCDYAIFLTFTKNGRSLSSARNSASRFCFMLNVYVSLRTGIVSVQLCVPVRRVCLLLLIIDASLRWKTLLLAPQGVGEEESLATIHPQKPYRYP